MMPDSDLKDNRSMLSQRNDATENIRVLVVADAEAMVDIASVLNPASQIDWQQATTEAEYLHRLSSDWDVILWSAERAKITLNEVVKSLLTANLTIPLLVINGESTISAAVAAVKAGATDYLPGDRLAELSDAIFQTIQDFPFFSLLPQYVVNTEQQIRKLISENPDGIIVVDDRGIVRFINPAALELLGKSGEDLINESLGFPVVNSDYLEVDIPRSPTEILVAQMRVTQIRWQGANAVLMSLRDITQIKQAEEERVKLLKEAQAANRAKDEFLAILSHELRTPLNPIVGWSQLLAKGNLPEAKVKQGAEIIQRNALLQTKLIEDILDISRIIRGKLKLQICPVNLVNIINNALDTVNLAAQAKSIQIETNLAENVGLIQGDYTRLQQVIWNLLSNAVKFTPNGGRVEISLTCDRDRQPIPYAVIEVKDSGKGIPPEFLAHVFDYFRQAESTKSRSEGGLGLGLAIVRRLVELHGGEVSAASLGVGKGATFTIKLPMLDNLSESVLQRSPKEAKNLTGKKVLVVDDDDDSRNLLCFILEQEGAEIKATTSATEALAAIEKFQPQILISDIGMPQIDGYELIQKVRQLPTEGGVMAIALSGYASEQDRQKSITAGFDHHLNKPIDVETFIKLVT